jgi:hypothetical protein
MASVAERAHRRVVRRVAQPGSPGLGVPLGGVDDLDVAKRTPGVRRAHAGERTRPVGRGVFRTTDATLQRALEASPLFADGSFWIDAG